MKNNTKLTIPLLLFSFFAFNNYCHAEITLMSEAQRKAQTGRGVSISRNSAGIIDLAMDGQTKNGIPISVKGTLDVLQKAHEINQATLSLNDAAQQNLRAVVNINAVDSVIQVLVNMNVMINSTVHSLEQANQALHNQEIFRQ